MSGGLTVTFLDLLRAAGLGVFPLLTLLAGCAHLFYLLVLGLPRAPATFSGHLRGSVRFGAGAEASPSNHFPSWAEMVPIRLASSE